MDAQAHRQKAAEARQAERESFQRCDTDGFLSQWALSMTARLEDRRAEIAERGGVWDFPALYDAATGERVKAKVVYCRNPRGYGDKVPKWLVLDENDDAVEWLPLNAKNHPRSKLVQRGYRQGTEEAPAGADTAAPEGARGLSGATQVYIKTYRRDKGYPDGARTKREIRAGGGNTAPAAPAEEEASYLNRGGEYRVRAGLVGTTEVARWDATSLNGRSELGTAVRGLADLSETEPYKPPYVLEWRPKNVRQRWQPMAHATGGLCTMAPGIDCD